MILATRSVLILSAVVLVAYPLWGVLYPESYSNEFTQHHEHAAEFTIAQVKQAAIWLWVSNGLLAFAFLLLAKFLIEPKKMRLGVGGGLALMVYPFVRTFTEAMMELAMNAPMVSINVSSEKMFFIIVGMLVICLVQRIQSE